MYKRQIVASARRSGLEDFQRVTPPVSLASCSIRPFLRACTSRSDPQSPRDRQHRDINPDPPATAQLQHAIMWKPYGLVPFFGYRRDGKGIFPRRGKTVKCNGRDFLDGSGRYELTVGELSTGRDGTGRDHSSILMTVFTVPSLSSIPPRP